MSHAGTILHDYPCADCEAPLRLSVAVRGQRKPRFTPLCDPCLAARVARVRAARSAAASRQSPADDGRPRTDDRVLRRAGTTCSYGHTLTPETIYVTPSGREDCAACRQTNMARYKARQRRRSHAA